MHVRDELSEIEGDISFGERLGGVGWGCMLSDLVVVKTKRTLATTLRTHLMLSPTKFVQLNM